LESKIVSGLSHGVVCVILGLAALVEHQLVMDGRTDRETHDVRVCVCVYVCVCLMFVSCKLHDSDFDVLITTMFRTIELLIIIVHV